ncbi:stationary phase protein 4 [Monosporozyma servazzii]
MPKFWDSFQVYNKNKHDNPELFGGKTSNTGSTSTQYKYSKEYYETEVQPVPATVGSMIVPQVPRRKSSVSSTSRRSSATSTNDNTGVSGLAKDDQFSTNNPLEGLDEATKKQISHMSQSEFRKVYESLRKGEPNNNVNF